MDTMSTSTSAHIAESKSYFEKNKKMIILLIILLLIFCGLISYIFISNRPSDPIIKGNTTVIPQPTPIVSSPVVTNPTPTPSPVPTLVAVPATKEISFILDEHVRVPGHGDDGYAKNLKFTLTVPSDSTSSAVTDDLAQDIVNSDFTLRISDLYEVSGIEHFTQRVELGVLPNIGTQVFRVKEENSTDNNMIYVNDQSIIDNKQCVWEAGGVTKEPACGGYSLAVSGRALQIRCTPKTDKAFDSCDSIVKSMKLEKL